jgi:hypothetical protein
VYVVAVALVPVMTTWPSEAQDLEPRSRAAIATLAAADWRSERREFVGVSFAYVWKRRMSSKFSQNRLSQ